MEELKTTIGILITLILTFAGIFKIAEKDCQYKAEIMNKPYIFNKLSGCFIKTKEGYVDYSKYKILNINKTLGEN